MTIDVDIRIDRERLCQKLDCALNIELRFAQRPEPYIGIRKVRVQLDGFDEVRNGFLVFALFRLGEPTIVIAVAKIRIEPDRCRKVGDCLLQLALLAEINADDGSIPRLLPGVACDLGAEPSPLDEPRSLTESVLRSGDGVSNFAI